MRHWLVVGLVCLGCDSGDSGGDPEPDLPVRRAADAEVAGDDMGETTPDAGGETPDAGEVDPDLGPDSAPLIRDLQSCEDICGVYEECGVLDEFDGTTEGCLAACRDAETSERFMGYRSCVQIAECDSVTRCAVPPKPLPACEAVCAAAEACDAEFRLPAGHPSYEDCAAACAADEDLMRRCGQALPEAEADACPEAEFARCILASRGTECLAICDRQAGCTPEDAPIDPIDCALECLSEQPSEDPLQERRRTSRRRCVIEAMADDCEAITLCDARAEADPEDIEAVCAADAECGFFEPEGCAELIRTSLPTLAPGAVECLAAAGEACEGQLACFRPAPAPLGICDEACHVDMLCGELPEGQMEFECAEACREGRGDPAYEAQLRCALSATCDDALACKEAADPQARCEALCERRGACGEIPEGCAADCVARFSTARVQAELGCTAAAATCDGVAACVAPPAPDCARLCAADEACDIADDGCLAECDDAHFADPGDFLPRAACVLSGDCAERAACRDGSYDSGAACLGWCRLQIECGEAEGELLDCFSTCGEGYEGREFLTFDAASECLGMAGDCEALQGCVDAVEDDDYCEEYCGELARCHVGEADACLAACAESPDDAVDSAVCTIAEIRDGHLCRPVAECVGAEVEPAGPGCAAFCARAFECDDSQDPFLCERECTPEPEGFRVRASCAERAECEICDGLVDR